MSVAALVVSQFVIVVESAGIATMPRAIAVGLHSNLTGVQFSIGGQLLFAAAFMTFAAHLGSVYGRRRIIVVGIVLRIVGTVMMVVAPNMGVFFLGRAVLCGISMACIMVNGLALVGKAFNDESRVRYSAMIAATVGLGFVVGPFIGGAMASTFGWRWFYVVILPLTVIAAVLSPLVPRVDRDATEKSLDLLGAGLAVTSFGCIIFGIQQFTTWGLLTPRSPPFTIIGHSPAPFVVLVGFVLLFSFGQYESRRRRRGRPVVFDTSLLRKRFIRGADLALIGTASVVLGALFLVPVYLQVGQGMGPLATSLRMVFYGLGAFVLSRLYSRISAGRSLRTMFLISSGFAALGALGLVWEIGPIHGGALPLAMGCFGMALSSARPSLQVATQRAVAARERGQVSAMNESAWFLGGALGVAIVGTVLLVTLSVGLERSILRNSAIGPEAEAVSEEFLDRGVAIVSDERVREKLTDAGVSPHDVAIITDHYSHSADTALLAAGLATAVLVVLTGATALRLPRRDPESV